ncbi:MAG: hypothetical protein FWE49_02665 [Synergistaceae bacterium]|nr:hypothetical protein [Synergistaceae bacterium]
MIITPIQTEKLFKNNLTFSLLSFSMLVTRLKVIYENDSSQEKLENCANEINAFLKKYGSIMEKDCIDISKL